MKKLNQTGVGSLNGRLIDSDSLVDAVAVPLERAKGSRLGKKGKVKRRAKNPFTTTPEFGVEAGVVELSADRLTARMAMRAEDSDGLRDHQLIHLMIMRE